MDKLHKEFPDLQEILIKADLFIRKNKRPPTVRNDPSSHINILKE